MDWGERNADAADKRCVVWDWKRRRGGESRGVDPVAELPSGWEMDGARDDLLRLVMKASVPGDIHDLSIQAITLSW